MIRRFVTILICCCSVPACGQSGSERSVLSQYLAVAQKCLQAQVKIGNPIFDAESGHPIDKSINTVEVVIVPDIGFYTLSFKAEPGYPDAPFSSCRVSKDTGIVLSASYQTAEPARESRNVRFVDRPSFQEPSEQELNVLLGKKKVTKFSVSLLFE